MVQKKIILFLEWEGFSSEALEHLQTVFDAAYCEIEDIANFVGKELVQALFVRLDSYIDASVLHHLPNLELLISPTTGHTHLDLKEIQRRGIKLLSLKGESDFLSSITATAELTWGLVLSLTRKIPQALTHTNSGGWQRDLFRGYDLSGQTIGIIGYGRIGRMIEQYAQAFRMNILVHDIISCVPRFGKFTSFSKLLAGSDFVTVHVDVNPSSVNMFGDTEFKQMKPDAYFINTSRGEIVCESALLDALKSGRLKGAAIDTIRDESSSLKLPAMRKSKLVKYARMHDKLIITPHLGGATVNAMEKTEIFITSKAMSYFTSA